MELQIFGRAEQSAVLLLPPRGMDAAQLRRRLQPLEKTYRLILPGKEGSAAELARALERAGETELWGAYGLREGATLLLALLAEGGVRVRTAVTEGAFSLPGRSLRDVPGRIVCWKGGKDKKAGKAWKKLKADVPGLRSLTLGKLKAGQDYLSLRPEKMAQRLAATFGTARTVRLADTLPAAPERVWRQLCRRPAGKALSRLTQAAPLMQDDERFTQRLEGRSRRLNLWSHTVRLAPLGDDKSVCTDQVDVEAGKLTPAAAALARLYLKREQKRRRALLRREK